MEPDPIDTMIATRRQAARGALDIKADAPRWGLALSGGGIRSATFCLGLLKALAEDSMLLRFDLLSTVSGGGYVGGMFGRLLGRCADVKEAVAVLAAFAARGSPWFLWWLRSNGRYLIPSGARDAVFALALYARNTLAVHVELGLLGLLLGCAIALVDLGGWWLRASQATSQTIEPVLQWFSPQADPATFVPVIAFLLIPAFLLSMAYACAYWAAPGVQRRPHLAVVQWMVWVLALGVVGGVGYLESRDLDAATLGAVSSRLGERAAAGLRILGDALSNASSPENAVRFAFLVFGAAVSVAWLIGLPLAWLASSRLAGTPAPSADERLAETRNALTRRLATTLRFTLVIVALAALDRLAWAMAFEFENQVRAGVVLAAVVVLVRAAAPLVATLKPGSFGIAAMLRVGSLLGMVASFLLIAWWTSLVQRAAFGAVFGQGGIELGDGLGFVVVIAVPAAAYVLLTRGNIDFLNASSLQTFYRSRLVRAYLGAVNPQRYPASAGPLPAHLEPANELPAEPVGGYQVRQVSDVDADDDLPMSRYAPFAAGGPVHLMTACVNQTDDPRGRFNRDRRGVPLTIAPQGWFRVDQQPWRQVAGDEALTLGNWISISGGAFSPGLGQNTRAGVAALITFAGVRLGYWWDGLKTAASRAPWFPKACALMDEARGHFPGTSSSYAFLSDGGHAENTGAWPLLVQRCRLIVLADCGADPAYRFADLENLVRRARIDLQTKIRFLVPKGPPRPPFEQFGTLDDLASPSSKACIALARVDYPEEGAAPAHLLLVKPNIWPELPPDIANYSAENPSFPQQTTLDQFFDEAQWESYYALGCALGTELFGALDRQAESGLAGAVDAVFERDPRPVAGAAARRLGQQRRELRASLGGAAAAYVRRRGPAVSADPSGASDAPRPSGRLAARLTASAVNASIGLGAAATIAISAWQGFDALFSARDQQAKDEHAALKEIVDLWAKIPSAPLAPASSAASAPAVSVASWNQYVDATVALAATIARTSDTLCPADQARWFTQSPLALQIFGDARDDCAAIARRQASPPACAWLSEATRSDALTTTCLKPANTVNACPPRYWGYDYRTFADAEKCVEPGLWASRQDRLLAQKNAAPAVATASTPTAPQLAPVAASLDETPMPTAQSQSQSQSLAQSLAQARPRPEPQLQQQPQLQSPSQTADVCTREPHAVCCGTTVYVQVYGSEDRSRAREWRHAWRSLGASVPPVDDVIASARASHRMAPGVVSLPSVRYNDPSTQRCAEAVIGAIDPGAAAGAWRTSRLGDPDASRRKQIEVWIPPGYAPKH